jgi:NadR type nicotinamide-nucleotide adenylyltransferase
METGKEIKKIAVIGPESTGKSTLCEQLAQHYNTMWCPEFAREYLLTHGMDYNFDDLLFIAKGQVAMEDEYIGMANRGKKPEPQQPHSPLTTHYSPLFIDTNMYVMKVWCEFVFNNCHQWILDQIIERKYDLYLLCNVDLPWVKDELREYPDLENRAKLYNIYEDIMINQTVPWVVISGDYEERLQKAITAVDALL